ncbi:MAG: three-Cys-motif partner protein TcmP [Cyclobacteriaceae bacterium]|nr:three-Cys-motif partner protein TcmP [Cyclobacteriaceae bacterium]
MINSIKDLIPKFPLPPSRYPDDGFSITAAEPWFKVKVQVIQSYLQSFVAKVAGRVDDIVFVDLFAGSGLYSLGHQKEIFSGSCLSALSSGLPITKWIFCEHDPEELKALKIRVNKYFRGKNVLILEHSPEELIDKFRMYVPQSKGKYKVATLCLVDPFSLAIHFETIRKLADQGFNFLMPFTFSLNNRLDHKFYLQEQPDKLGCFIGNVKELERFSGVDSNAQFYKRLVRIYQSNMLMLGLNTAMSIHKVDSGLMELPVYYMGFFSRQISTKSIQQDVQLSEVVQFELF